MDLELDHFHLVLDPRYWLHCLFRPDLDPLVLDSQDRPRCFLQFRLDLLALPVVQQRWGLLVLVLPHQSRELRPPHPVDVHRHDDISCLTNYSIAVSPLRLCRTLNIWSWNVLVPKCRRNNCYRVNGCFRYAMKTHNVVVQFRIDGIVKHTSVSPSNGI